MSTDESSSSSNEPSRSSWRFSIRGLLILVFGCAVGFARLRYWGHSWWQATAAAGLAISVWIVIGLLTQAWALRQRLRQHELSPDARCALRFGIGWRWAIGTLLVAYHAVEHIGAEVFESDQALMAGWHPEVIYYLVLVVILASIRSGGKRRRPPKDQYLRYGLVWILGIIYCSIALYDQLTVHYLVYIAVRGIEASNSLFPPFLDGVNPLFVQRAEPAFWLGISSAALMPFNFLFIYFAARSRSVRRRRICQVLFPIGFSVMTGLFLWNCLIALPTAAPLMMAQRIEGGVWHFLLIAAPCLLILTTATAYRWTAAFSKPTPDDEQRVAVREPPYLHERRLLVGALAGVLLIDLGRTVIQLLDPSLSLAAWNWGDACYLFVFRSMPAGIAVCILATQKALTGKRQAQFPPVSLPELSFKRFLSVWLALIMTLLVAIPVSAAYGFALWLAIWFV